MSKVEDNLARLAHHERLVHALLHDPAALEVPPLERSLVQTHISSLIVAASRVYKLRKPLELEFLNFSTPALRQADCEEELRLNRRTAPQVYLDVVPVTGTPGAPRLGGPPQQAIDWALRMQRFDDSQRLDRLADRGCLTAAHIDALALEVARFHEALPPSPGEFGRPEIVRHWALENFDTLQSGPAAQTHGAALQTLRAWTEDQFKRLAPLLAERRAAGRVREGHGDLHLGNIVLVEGRPLPFDCLEFNPALRHGDVMADLAFLFMDLHRHRLGSLAWRLINLYAERTGDYAGLGLLGFFTVYRAMVRAKVALMRAEQHDPEAWTAFERDWQLARSLAAPRPQPPRLILTSGLSGSGKSTLAMLLVETLGAIRIRSDVERKRLFGLEATARPDRAQVDQLYSHETSQRTYARLVELARTLLGAGFDTIVDATFLRRAERDQMRELATQMGVRMVLIECTAPESVMRDRVGQRQTSGTDASDADLAVLDAQGRAREAAGDDESPCRIDTACTLDTLCASALKCLGNAHPEIQRSA